MVEEISARDEAMRRLVSEMVYSLVDRADEVRVEIVHGTGYSTVRLHVANSDLGKVIGKHGRTARSLRTILGAACTKLQWRYVLDLPVGSEHQQ